MNKQTNHLLCALVSLIIPASALFAQSRHSDAHDQVGKTMLYQHYEEFIQQNEEKWMPSLFWGEGVDVIHDKFKIEWQYSDTY